MDNSLDQSLEQRFVDRLLHTLAAMGNYEAEPEQQATPTGPAPLHTEMAALPRH